MVIETTDPSGSLDVAREELGDVSEISKATIREHILKAIDTLQADTYIFDENLKKELFLELRRFYRFNDYKLAWSDLDAPSTEAKILLNELSSADEHGLNPELYNIETILELEDEAYNFSHEVNLADVMHLDFMMSAAYITYTWHLYNGRMNPKDLSNKWVSTRKKLELAHYLAGKSVRSGIELVEPQSLAYSELVKKLDVLISIANEGGWEPLPDSVELRPGDYNELVTYVRERLVLSSDFTRGLKQQEYNPVYDEALSTAVRKFQKRHGLDANGVINKQTIEELNIPIETRIEQIKINLERLRWMPRNIPDEYLLVNIPEFSLKLMKKEKEIQSMRAIVGNTESPTPVLNAKVEVITFSPTWFVSDQDFNRIALPRVKENPDYLRQTGYTLYARNDKDGANPIDIESVKWNSLKAINSKYRVAHTPGPNDKMKGQIKFVMPNQEDLFISDASTTSLFDFSFRAFNNSSISIEQPALLAKYLIDQRKWSIDLINEKMHQPKPENVTITSYPIYVVYLTTWVDKYGVLNFRKDLYGYDATQRDFLHKDEIDLVDE